MDIRIVGNGFITKKLWPSEVLWFQAYPSTLGVHNAYAGRTLEYAGVLTRGGRECSSEYAGTIICTLGVH